MSDARSRRGRPRCVPQFPLHSPDFFAGDPYPAYKELRASAPVCWNDVTKFWALLKYEDIRYVSTQPRQVLLDQGHHHPRPRDAEPGAGGQPHLHRSAATPSAAQADQHRVHPAAGGDPRAEGARDRLRRSRRGPIRVHRRVRRIACRALAHPDDRRVARRATRRLGKVPQVVRRVYRQRRSRDRARFVRGDRRAVRVLPAADRGAPRRAAGTTCCRS